MTILYRRRMGRPRAHPRFYGYPVKRWSGELTESIGARPSPGAKRVRVGALEMPERFTAWVKRADPMQPDVFLEVVVDNGQPVCESVWCRRKEDGPSVTGSNLREIPVETVLRSAFRLVATGGSGGPLGDDDERVLDQAFASYRRSVEQKGRGRRLTDDHLQAVAYVYLSAEAMGAAPTEAVKQVFRLGARSTAARQVHLARERGFLPEWRGKTRKG
jgi:hypothetical protein